MTIELTDLLYHVPGFLDGAQCDHLIEEYERRASEAHVERSVDAASGKATYASFRAIPLVKGTKPFELVHAATEEMLRRYHDHLDTFEAFHASRRSSMAYSHAYRVLKYETGAKIHPHIDHDPYVYGSCTFNLNDDYSGGRLVFFRGRHALSLGRGDAVIWPADYFWVHEVEEVTSGTRYSTNGFLQSIPRSVRKRVAEFTREQMAEYRASAELDDGLFHAVRPSSKDGSTSS